MNTRKIVILGAISLLSLGLLSFFFIGSRSNQPLTSNASTSVERSSPTAAGSSFTSSASSQAAKQSPQSTPASKANLFRSSTISTLPTGTGAAATSELGGTPAQATVLVKGKKINLTPDEIGFFPRILLGVNEKVKVVVSYPEGTPEDPLVIQAEDGGHVNQNQIVTHGKLDASKQISFDFEAGENDGIYRVTVRKGFDEKRLDFWVGPELQTTKGS